MPRRSIAGPIGTRAGDTYVRSGGIDSALHQSVANYQSEWSLLVDARIVRGSGCQALRLRQARLEPTVWQRCKNKRNSTARGAHDGY